MCVVPISLEGYAKRATEDLFDEQTNNKQVGGKKLELSEKDFDAERHTQSRSSRPTDPPDFESTAGCL